MTATLSPIQAIVDKFVDDTIVWIKAKPLLQLSKDEKVAYVKTLEKALKDL
jgi:hypothetical protein